MGKWTKTQLNRLREQLTAQGRSIDEIADEIRHQCGCSKLAAYRMAHGWSQPQATERYKQTTGGPMDQPLLSKLEQFPAPGIRGPQAAQLIGFATVYGTTPLRLVAADAPRLPRAGRADPLQCRVHANTAATARWGHRRTPG